MTIYFFVNQSTTPLVTIDICGWDRIELQHCDVESVPWIVLVLEKVKEQALRFNCNGMQSAIFGEECAGKVGDDITYFSVDATFEGSFMYKIRSSEGMEQQFPSLFKISYLQLLDFSHFYVAMVISCVHYNLIIT